MLVMADEAGDHGEERWIGIAPKGERLYTIVFTVRGEDRMRVISLRPATNSEIRRYEQQGKRQSEVRPKHRRRGKPD
ncbi:MAG: BrnT family toxin [Steroidobacteraceae bacterium]